MVIFEYKVAPAWLCPNIDTKIFYIRITDDAEGNVKTFFFGKKNTYTLSNDDIDKVKAIIRAGPGLFSIKDLEPNAVLDGDEYSFVFSDGERINRFKGYNILDYGQKPRKNATLALRTARAIKDQVLLRNHIRTLIPNRLQHWPRYRKSSSLIKI